MRESALTRNFDLVSAPTLFAALHFMMFNNGANMQEVLDLREAHRELLHELLRRNEPSRTAADVEQS